MTRMLRLPVAVLRWLLRERTLAMIVTGLGVMLLRHGLGEAYGPLDDIVTGLVFVLAGLFLIRVDDDA